MSNYFFLFFFAKNLEENMHRYWIRWIILVVILKQICFKVLWSATSYAKFSAENKQESAMRCLSNVDLVIFLQIKKEINRDLFWRGWGGAEI